MNEHLSRFAIEEAAAGEVSLTTRAHLLACPACGARVERAGQAAARYLERFPAAPFAAAVAARAERAPRWRWAAGLALVAGLATVALLAWPRPEVELVAIRAKGGPGLTVFARRGERTWQVTAGDTLLPGDRLGFAYQASRAGVPLLLGMDETGAVATYHAGAAPLPAGRGQLPIAVELDARRGRDKLFFLWSSAAIDPGPLEAALRRQLAARGDLGAVELPGATSIWFARP